MRKSLWMRLADKPLERPGIDLDGDAYRHRAGRSAPSRSPDNTPAMSNDDSS